MSNNRNNRNTNETSSTPRIVAGKYTGTYCVITPSGDRIQCHNFPTAKQLVKSLI
jgi:hypothetical protein